MVSGLTLKASPRARAMRLRVDSRTGAVVLTYPHRTSERRALDWAKSQSAWIEAQLAKVPAPAPIAAGAEIPLEGVPHMIDWQPARPRTVRIEDGRILLERSTSKPAHMPRTPASQSAASPSVTRSRAGEAAHFQARSATAGG